MVKKRQKKLEVDNLKQRADVLGATLVASDQVSRKNLKKLDTALHKAKMFVCDLFQVAETWNNEILYATWNKKRKDLKSVKMAKKDLESAARDVEEEVERVEAAQSQTARDALNAKVDQRAELFREKTHGVDEQLCIARIQKKKENVAEAAESFRRVLKVEPTNLHALLNLADLNLNAKYKFDSRNREEGVSLCEAALEVDKEYVPALIYLAMLRGKEDPKHAAALFRRALQAEPKNVIALLRFAQLIERNQEVFSDLEDGVSQEDPADLFRRVSATKGLNPEECISPEYLMIVGSFAYDDYKYPREMHRKYLHEARLGLDGIEGAAEQRKTAIAADPELEEAPVDPENVARATRDKSTGTAPLHVIILLP